MNYNYTLKYRTFESLLEDVKVDLKSLTTDGTIDPSQLIKVATRINYDLGLRIYMTKERLLKVEKNRVRLPSDFYVMNFALLCGEFTEMDDNLEWLSRTMSASVVTITDNTGMAAITVTVIG